MKLLRIKDNSLYKRDSFSDVEYLTRRILDKTLEQLEREGVFVFPEFVIEAEDITKDQMEDNRDEFVVIVAGYPDPMEQFLKSNPGLRSRFNRNIIFEDYSEEELFQILEAFCQPFCMKLSSEAESSVKAYLHWLVQHKPENFANGRAMRNLFESSIASQANRLADLTDISNEELNELAREDLPEWVRDGPFVSVPLYTS